MRITPIITPINKSLSNTHNITKTVANSIKTLSKSVNKKELGILSGLAILGAASALLVKTYMDNRTSKDANHPVVRLIRENPQRAKYIETLSKYPTLSDKYYQMMENCSLNGDEGLASKNILNIFEIIMGGLSAPAYNEQRTSILESLEKNYSNDLSNICINFYNIGKNGSSVNEFFECLKDKRFSSEELKDWTKYPLFNVKEFSRIKNDKVKIKEFFHNLLTKGKIEHFKLEKGKYDDTSYFFKIKFKEDIPTDERKKIIIKAHETLYGPVRLQIKEKKHAGYRVEDIENELYERLQKDKTLDALYNLLKFINPDSLSKYDYTSKQVKYLHWEGDKYKELRKDLGASVIDINYSKSPKIKELIKLMNNKELFNGVSDNCHAILRIIARIVLKDNFTPDLLADSKARIEELNNEIEKKFIGVIPIFRYKYANGCAPCFYLGKTTLGEYLKITLNKKGEIHTIFEDINRTNLADILIK